MYDELDSLNRKIDFNENLVRDMITKINSLEKEKENQKDRFDEVQLMQRLRYEDLHRKYKELQHKSSECENLQDQRQYQFHLTIEKSNQQKDELENMQL